MNMQHHPMNSAYRGRHLEAVRFFGRAFAILIGSLGLAAGAQAQLSVIDTVNDPLGDSGFTLTFPDLGVTTSSSVINTQIEIEIDEEARTARFLKYSQSVEPLLLPGPEEELISTGDITIRILSSNGTYNPSTETFVTNDVFEISFTNNLGSFGLTSPTVLPATSTGTVTGGTSNTQRIDMIWEGSGELGDPANPLRFEYVSKNFTVIEPPMDQLLSPLQACGDGLAELFGLATISLLFVGLKYRVRRRGRS